MSDPGQPGGGVVQRQLDIFPDLLPLHDANPQRYPYLLESVAHGTPQARYDILFAFPGEQLRLDHTYRVSANGKAVANKGFLTCLTDWWRRERRPGGGGEGPPFHGGWFVFLGYELVAEIEPVLQLPEADPALPVAVATRIPAAIVRDHDTCSTWLVAEAGADGLLAEMERDLRTPSQAVPAPAIVATALSEDPPGRYLSAVRRIKDYIVEGDVFQVNLSRGWYAELVSDISDAQLYDRLRSSNPAPFAGLMRMGNTTIISSSPERLFEVRGTQIQTRPIAGTRPRGENDQSDAAFSRELLAHPKEQAEHIMLIDLERNDLGRVCVPGTVRVDELMVLESYAHVHHIVSNVRGQLRADIAPGDVIRAAFPGGTITGCPKIRCMEIIAELEQVPRGPYTGSMGYLNLDGSMDFNILIRTMSRTGDAISFRAGAGIVADSDPEWELEETRAKARGMALALTG